MTIDTVGFWKTRDGRKVRIYATDGRRQYPIHGAILMGGEWAESSWLADGAHSAELPPRDTDIVGRWPEEREVEVWVWLQRNGTVVAHCTALTGYPRGGQPYKLPTDAVDAVGAVRLTGKIIEGVFE